jgi:hypothetical protein
MHGKAVLLLAGLGNTLSFDLHGHFTSGSHQEENELTWSSSPFGMLNETME